MTRRLTASLRDHAEQLFRYHDVTETPGPVDLIIGLGSYQPAVADCCGRLYREGIAPCILFTGGLGNWTRESFDRPEAEIFRDRAVAAGVPAAAILVEPEARHLGENASLARRLLETAGLGPRRIAVVTKRNTTRRARSTFRRVWPQMTGTFHGPDMHWSEQAVPPRNAGDVVDELVGDLQRILVYPALGHQLPETVPPDVLDSYVELIRAGFDRHLLADHPALPDGAARATAP